MTNIDFHTTIVVNASAEEVSRKICQVNEWWAKNLKGVSENPGDRFSVYFGETYVDFQIKELKTGKKVVWEVTDCNLHWINEKKEWNGTEVVFELIENENMTQIDFTHVGLIPTAKCYDNCEAGWTQHITVSLANFINDGKGIPA